MPEILPLLKPVDRLEITILVDNSIDVFLPSTAQVRRAHSPGAERPHEGSVFHGPVGHLHRGHRKTGALRGMLRSGFATLRVGL